MVIRNFQESERNLSDKALVYKAPAGLKNDPHLFGSGLPEGVDPVEFFANRSSVLPRSRRDN